MQLVLSVAELDVGGGVTRHPQVGIALRKWYWVWLPTRPQLDIMGPRLLD